MDGRALLTLLWVLVGAAGAQPVAVAPPRFDAQGRAIGPPLSDRVVDYAIDARLDVQVKRLVGHERVTWRNRSQEPQGTLWFHLYWNAFKNRDSTASREFFVLGGFRDSGGHGPGVKPEDWGYSDIRSLAVEHGADLLPTLKFQHPDDDNAQDQTVFTVTLPTPVPPGGAVTLDIRWEAKVPHAVARAGYEGDYFLISQWFPKLGVLEVPPTRGVTRPRWNCHQYHTTTEFYADFGTYDAQLTVPKGLRVGATGVRLSSTENPDGTVTHHFHQDDVHDFAWTAWKGFDEAEDTFRAEGMPEVKLSVLYPRGHVAGARQTLDALKASLLRYGTWLVPFPYPHLTVVNPPARAGATGGMEYPTFITSADRAFPTAPKDRILWEVVAHEFAHNYFYGLVASNEFEESWLDEGMTSYLTSRLLTAEDVRFDLGGMLPPPLRTLLGGIFQSALTPEDFTFDAARERWSSPVIREGWKYLNLADYGVNSYTRPELNLDTLERELGTPTMLRVLKAYVEAYRFRHPDSGDFFRVASEVSGRDLRGFEERFFQSADGLDYAVRDLRCEERDPDRPEGVYDTPRGHVTRDPSKEKAGPAVARVHACLVVVERRQPVAVPVVVKVTFEDGQSVLEHWDGQERWRRFLYTRPGPKGAVQEARVDPDDTLAVDADKMNNGETARFQPAAPLSLMGWLLYVGQLVGAGVGGLF